MKDREYAKGFWNLYLAGIALGLVLLLTFYLMGPGLGASGAFARTATVIAHGVAPPAWGSFYMSSPLGRITLWQEFGISKELMAAAIVVMALMAFWLAGLAEKWAPYDRRQITRQKSGFHAED